MNKEARFWMVLVAAMVGAFFVMIHFTTAAARGTTQESVPAPTTNVITIPAPEAPAPTTATKFVLGDKVTVDGLTLLDGTVPSLTVVEVGEVVEWTNRLTGESVKFRKYTVEISVEGQTDRIEVPEVVLHKVQ